MSIAAHQTYSLRRSHEQAGSRYREMEIATADPFELVLILYRGAVENLRRALEYFAAGAIQERINAINKAGAMIGELRSTLDFDRGDQIASSLERLYAYMLKRLLEANLQQDTAAVHEVIKLLKTLESAWEETQMRSVGRHSNGERIELSA